MKTKPDTLNKLDRPGKIGQYFYRKINRIPYQKMQNFNQFVQYVGGLDLKKCDRHLRLQSSLIDLNHVDDIGRLETFNVDFHHILKKLGISAAGIKPQNVTIDRKPYHEYYTPQTRDLVYQLYRKDIQLFGYRFDEAV